MCQYTGLWAKLDTTDQMSHLGRFSRSNHGSLVSMCMIAQNDSFEFAANWYSYRIVHDIIVHIWTKLKLHVYAKWALFSFIQNFNQSHSLINHPPTYTFGSAGLALKNFNLRTQNH